MDEAIQNKENSPETADLDGCVFSPMSKLPLITTTQLV